MHFRPAFNRAKGKVKNEKTKIAITEGALSPPKNCHPHFHSSPFRFVPSDTFFRFAF